MTAENPCMGDSAAGTSLPWAPAPQTRAIVHNNNFVSNIFHSSKIMRNEHVSQAKRILQISK
jgi:hypothetical protein